MAKYVYPEEFQDFPRSEKKECIKPTHMGPSQMTLKFIIGYGAALKVIKSSKLGNMKILLN